jgi:hypothetical protein
MRYVIFVFLTAYVAIAPVSSRGQTKSTSGTVSASTKDIAELRAQVKDLQVKVQQLDSQITFYYKLLADKQDRKDSVSLDLSEKTYQRLDVDNGFLLISVESAEPYLTGYKLHLNIGNPLLVTYPGFKAKVKWSKAYDYSKFTSPSFEEWKKSVQEKEFDLPNSLSSGNWNPVELVLAPATPEQLGDVELSITTNIVRLYTK